MNRRLFGTCGVLAITALSVGSCKSDPLSDLDGTPARVVVDFSYLQMPLGDTSTITAQVLDGRTTPLEVPITFTACSPAVSVSIDTSYHPVPVTSARAKVVASSAAPSCVVVEGGGIQDTVTVAVLPTTFNGTLSATTLNVGDTLKLFGNAQLGFDVDSADVDFGEGVHGELQHRVGDTLIIQVPAPDVTQPAAATVEHVVVKYVPGLITNLLTVPLTISSAFAHASGGPAAFVVPADGDSVEFFDGFPSDGTDYWYPFTIASQDTLVFTLSWNTDADLDMASCNGVFTGCTGGFGAATGANPETFTVVYPPGNYNLLIEQFDPGTSGAHIFKVKVKNP